MWLFPSAVLVLCVCLFLPTAFGECDKDSRQGCTEEDGGSFAIQQRWDVVTPNVEVGRLGRHVVETKRGEHVVKRSWFSSSRSSSTGRSRSTSTSRSRSTSSSRSGGFRNRVRSSFNNARSRISSGYRRAKTKIRSGYNNVRNRLSSSSRRSSGRNRGSSNSRGSSYRNRGSSSTSNSWFGGSRGNSRGSHSTSSGRGRGGSSSNSGSLRTRVSNRLSGLKNRIFGGGRSSGSSTRSTGRGGSTGGSGSRRTSPGSGSGSGSSFRSRWSNRLSGLKNKILGRGRGGSSGASGRGGTGTGSGSGAGSRTSGSSSIRRRIGNGVSKLKNKILGRKTGGSTRVPESNRRYLGIISGGGGGGSNGVSGLSGSGSATGRTSQPKQSLFSKIKSKAVPFLKKASTQRMLKKGAKWLVRKYKSRNRNRAGAAGGYGNRNRYSAMGIYGPGGYGAYGGGGYPYDYDNGGGLYPGPDGTYERGMGGSASSRGQFFGRRTPEVASTEWRSGANKGTELIQGNSLSGGESLMSPNGKFEAYLDPAGDFILYSHDAEVAYWHTDTSGSTSNSYKLTMEYDSNLVLRDTTTRQDLWASMTKNMGLGFARLKLKDDGSLVVFDQRGTALWKSTYTEDTLDPRLALYNNQSMVETNDAMASPNQRYYAMIEEGTGRLVVYDGVEDKVIWSSVNEQQGHSPFRLTMQPNNNLVVYDKDAKVIWSSKTEGKGIGAAMARLSDGGALVIQDSQDTQLWTSANQTVPLL